MMSEANSFEVWVLAAAMAALLWVWYRHTRKRTRQIRGAMFERCRTILHSPVIRQDDVNFPVLTGLYFGHRVKLEPIFDQVVFRKLPSLWLSVSVYRPLPVDGVLDYLVRPQNTEFYSPWADMPIELEIPEAWPRHAVLRTNTDRKWPLEIITPFMDLFDDLKMKEMLISPRGIRFVYQAAQSERSQYLVLRLPDFQNLEVDPERITGLLDHTNALADSLIAGNRPLQPLQRKQTAPDSPIPLIKPDTALARG